MTTRLTMSRPVSLCAIAFLTLLAPLTSVACGQSGDSYRDARQKMVQEELIREGIRKKPVLDSMRSVPRHLFVSPEIRANAYFDQALPIGYQQTISPPFIVAYMTEVIDPQPTDKVLEIGTGSGYQAAVLSGIVKDVYTIEIVRELGESAAARLSSLGYKNVTCRVGDGYKGWEEHAPFDKIIVTCSPEKIPEPLVAQLKEGGRMIIPLGERYDQVFYLLEKTNGELKKKELLPAMFVPMTGISEDNREVLPDPAKPAVRNGGFEEELNTRGLVNGWYYQRQVKIDQREPREGKKFLTFENRTAGRGSQVLQGMGIDGSRVSAIDIRIWVRGQGLKYGQHTWERPGLMVHYFDKQRNPVGNETIGPWRGSFPWTEVTAVISVPPTAAEAVLRIGLNGATGTLSVDDLRFSPVSR